MPVRVVVLVIDHGLSTVGWWRSDWSEAAADVGAARDDAHVVPRALGGGRAAVRRWTAGRAARGSTRVRRACVGRRPRERSTAALRAAHPVRAVRRGRAAARHRAPRRTGDLRAAIDVRVEARLESAAAAAVARGHSDSEAAAAARVAVALAAGGPEVADLVARGATTEAHGDARALHVRCTVTERGWRVGAGRREGNRQQAGRAGQQRQSTKSHGHLAVGSERRTVSDERSRYERPAPAQPRALSCVCITWMAASASAVTRSRGRRPR